MAYLKAVHPGVALERQVDSLVVKLLRLAAIVADLEGCEVIVGMATHRVTASYECIQAFKSMNPFERDKLFERTIYLQWCIETCVSQLIEDTIRSEGAIRLFKHREDQMLISGHPVFCNAA